jgi:hypothetical protein
MAVGAILYLWRNESVKYDFFVSIHVNPFLFIIHFVIIILRMQHVTDFYVVY